MKVSKETIRRAARTFAQAAVAYIVVNLPLVDFSNGKDVVKHSLIGLGMSAIAAGIAAIMNLEENSEV